MIKKTPTIYVRCPFQQTFEQVFNTYFTQIYKFSFFTVLILKEKVGGSAEVFRAVGEKWRDLPDESKEEYNKKAREAACNPTVPSNSERALKIINNIMREVFEQPCTCKRIPF